MKTEKEKMLGGELYNAMDPVLYAERIRAKELLYDYNHTRPSEKEIRERILRELLGGTGNDFLIMCGKRDKNEETYKTCLERIQLSVCRTGSPGV